MNQKLLKRALLVCLGFMLMGVGAAYAQVHTVSGFVTSAEDQSPLIGVQVVIKGTSTGAITDSEGKYSIRVRPNDVLVFTYLGYKTREEQVSSRTGLDIVLSTDAQRMDEVIVMGYSSTKKAELTSAVVTLDNEALTDVQTSDVGNLLQGKVAGVMVYNTSGQPGSGAGIRVRGVGSLNSGVEPLFVVDGVAGGSYNPNDIETITVLKDVGATAIYGASGANGVIVITTKQAARNQPVKIELKASGGMKQALFGRFSPMDSEELYDLHELVFPSATFLGQRPEWLLDEDFDWLDATFNWGNVQNYYVSAAGGNDKLRYRASIDRYNEKGTLINTDYGRTAVRLNLTAQLARNLDMTIRADYQENTNNSGSSYHTIEGSYRAMPWDNPYDADGNLVYISTDKRPDREAYNPATNNRRQNNTWFGKDRLNFLHDEAYNFQRSKGKSLNGDVVLNWNITNWLSASSTNRFSRSDWRYTEYLDPRTKTGYGANPYHGEISVSEGMSESFSTSNLLKAAYQFGDHSLSGLVGWEWGEGNYETMGVAGAGMMEGVKNIGSSIPIGVSGDLMPSWGWSTFAQAQYNYQSRYFFTGVVRVDSSSKFGPKHRVGYFPAISGAWLISNERFMRNSEAITFLKLRASYGSVGNDRIPEFQYLDAFTSSSHYQNNVAAIPSRLANPNLHWETATTLGIGLDINLYDWLEVNIDLYDRVNDGLLMERPTATSSGFFSIWDNVGTMKNQGLELQLTSTNWRTKDFLWTTSFNIAFNKNKMTKLILSDDADFVTKAQDPSQILKNGVDVYTWYMPEWYGVDPDNGDALWYDADGNPTNVYSKAAMRELGSAMPKFYGGLHNSLSYKNLTLNFNFTYNYGNLIYNATRTSMDADGHTTDYNQMSWDNGLGWTRWESPGDEATHPRVKHTNSNGNSSRYLEDGSYVRLRNATLSYDFPQKWISKIGMSAARVYISGDNLFTISKFSGADPEVDLEDATWQLAGTYSMNYPVGRIYSVGLEITF